MQNYVVGIDVGTHSVGMTAVAVDDQGIPTEILSSISHIHDSGVDPDNVKEALTRKAVSGVARRTRRLFRKKRRRLIQLDKHLEGLGWPVVPLEEYEDPFLPWKTRAELATQRIVNVEVRNEKLSIAMRHIARHRGWRNPYAKVSSLLVETEPSDAFQTIREEVTKTTGIPVPEDATVGQMIAQCALGSQRLRGEGGVLCARLQQSDHAREIRRICVVQGIDDATMRELIGAVFKAESPKGNAAARAGKDPLQPSKYRALKANDAFQRYRIATLIGNLRIRGNEVTRPLTSEETRLVFDHLMNLKPTTDPSWTKISETLGIDRGSLVGTATMTDDGERAGAKPPVHDTDRVMSKCKVKPLVLWWKGATKEQRREMIKALSNAEVEDFDSAAGASVQEFFLSLADEDFEKLDKLRLPLGRAAYSEDTLDRIADYILKHGGDLQTARKAVFNIDDKWTPPVPAIGEPVGNPAVDRVLKVVARWLNAAIREWGVPVSVNIEHVRSGFTSESQARTILRENQKREKRNLELLEQMQATLGITGRPRRADLWRFQSVQRQNCQCAYCGATITYQSCEMDHIVPRAGQGSTNTRENLIAACKRCNQSKSNTPFAMWAKKCGIPGVSVDEAIERTRHWIVDPGLNGKDFKRFVGEVCSRLKCETIDAEVDARSLESVAWMANELRARIAQYLISISGDQHNRVRVYRGALTAEARRASDISRNLRFIDGVGKSRFDRRHHAVDAAVIAVINPKVSEVLALRTNLRFDQELRQKAPQWKEFTGSTPEQRTAWGKWQLKMQALGQLLQQALLQDQVVVTSNLRLRLGNGAAHEDTIRPLKTLKVGEAISVQDIDRASSEALWCALTRHPDFHPKTGLCENPYREIRVHGKTLRANDPIKVFPIRAAALAVRGGCVELGSSFHHARIYKLNNGKKQTYAMLRVYTTDLLKYRDQDLFNVELKPQTVSLRYCEPKLRKAIMEGTAEYLGWIVVDDEIEIDPTKFNTGQVGEVQAAIGAITRWRIDGFYTESRLRLRPIQLSAEGINDEMPKVVTKMVKTPGWCPAVNQVWSSGNVQVIRRDSLGRIRHKSNAHLPTSWKDET